MEVFQIVGFGLTALCIVLVVKSVRPEQAMLISIVAIVGLALFAAGQILGITEQLESAAKEYGIETKYLAIVIKVLGIAYVIQLSSDICKDAGETALASGVELCGKVIILTASMPAILKIISMLTELLKVV